MKRIDGRQKEINSASRNLSVLGGGQFTLAISGSDFDVQCDLRSKDKKLLCDAMGTRFEPMIVKLFDRGYLPLRT